MGTSSTYDVVVVGSGAAGLTAATVAATAGATVLLLESTELIGGTSAISGGMVWMPANSKMRAAGQPDDSEEVQRYLASTLPSTDLPTLHAYLDRCDEALSYLETHTSAVRLRPVERYPDYCPELPGATAGGRVLEALPFDGSTLGPWFRNLRPPLPELTILGGMMVSRDDIWAFRRCAVSPAAAARAGKLVARHIRERARAPRGTTLYLGNALIGRLLRSALDAGVQVRVKSPVLRIITGAERVVGVALDGGRGHVEVRAERGVVLATGGLSHDPELRKRFVPCGAFGQSAAVGSDGAASGARLAQEIGGQLTDSTLAGGFWVPCSTFTRRDGTAALYPHIVTDRSKPGLIAVNHAGRRFVNEARSYHHFGAAQLRSHGEACPAYLICDRLFVWRYGLGRVKPFSPFVRRAVSSGYLIRARTLRELAVRIGVPADALQTTVAEYNRHAQRGEDPQFGRGSDIYQRHLGDRRHEPNPCVAPIVRSPFFALPVHPTDLGMSAGLKTDSDARVLSASGAPIAGLYACGNDMDSVMQGSYPGPGITLGPAVTFGYLAALAAANTECTAASEH